MSQQQVNECLAIVNEPFNVKDEVKLKAKETAILQLSTIFKENSLANEMVKLIQTLLSFWTSIPAAKTAKLVKILLDDFHSIPESLPLQIVSCKALIEWAAKEKRNFLMQSLQSRLIALHFEAMHYQEALTLIGMLMKELKRLDDKMALLNVHLMESKVYFAVKNYPKARAALTSARTLANAIYCPPLLQADLDVQSGILHAQDKDYKTAYSYFFESLDAYSTQNDPKAIHSLKYMLLCKILLNAADEVPSILISKLGSRYSGSHVEAMRQVAIASQERSLSMFEDTLRKFIPELEDPIIQSHLSALYDSLLEQNLLRVIEPFSKVPITHIAKLVSLPPATVEGKLSKMILDKQLSGILDQGAGCLIIYEEKGTDLMYENILNTVKSLNNVVDSLFLKAGSLVVN